MTTATPEQMAAWPAPNYEDPESLRSMLIGITAPSVALIFAFMGIRLYSRGVLRQSLGSDDFVMLAAALCSIPICVIALVSLNYGLALHIWDQRPELWHVPYSKMAFVATILFPIACSLTKVSLCLTYLRLFPSRMDRVFCIVMITFLILYTIVCILLMLFQCAPIQGYWDESVNFECINMRHTLITTASLNSFSDCLVYLWPAKSLWNLHLPLKQRLGLILLFSIGAVVCVAGVIRTYLLNVYFTSYDLLWNASKVYAFMVLEMTLGIVCGCLTGVKALLAKLFPEYFDSSCRKATSSAGYCNFDNNNYGSGQPSSTTFHPLSGVVTLTPPVGDFKPHTGIGVAAREIGDMEYVHVNSDRGTSFAWIMSDGMPEEGSGNRRESDVPLGVIQVQTVVKRVEEDVELASPSEKRRMSDTGSETMIMNEWESTQAVGIAR